MPNDSLEEIERLKKEMLQQGALKKALRAAKR